MAATDPNENNPPRVKPVITGEILDGNELLTIMSFFKAEDIPVEIDGIKILANTLSFQTSKSYAEDRRFDKEISASGFLQNAPNKSSMSISFYATGNAYSNNPVFDLLSGLDAKASGVLDPDLSQGAIFRVRKDNAGLIWEWDENYHTFFYKNNIFYRDGIQVGSSESQTIYPWENPAYSFFFERYGYLGCVTGSTIKLGDSNFASGAALTSFSFNFSPFEVIEFKADFDIYNEVNQVFETGGLGLNVDPDEIAHGFSSTFSGVNNIEELQSISYSIRADRVPRYVVGKKDVYEIKTTKAQKEVSFQGWGRSENLLEDPSALKITLKSQNGTVFEDTVQGKIIDESFEIPNVGIMSKNFRIIQNLV